MGETRSDNDPTAVVPRRIAAYIIDGLFVAGFALAMALLFFDTTTGGVCDGYGGVCFGDSEGGRVFYADNDNAFAVLALPALLWVLMHVVLQGLTGATPGKALMGLRTVDADDYSLAGMKKTLIRSILFIVDGIFAIGLLAALFTKGHRRIGDMAAGTVVVASQSLGKKQATAAAVETGAPAVDGGVAPAWGAAAPATEVPTPSATPAWGETAAEPAVGVAETPVAAWGEVPETPAWGETGSSGIPPAPAVEEVPIPAVEEPSVPSVPSPEVPQGFATDVPDSPWGITPSETDVPDQAFDPFGSAAGDEPPAQVEPSAQSTISGDAFTQPLASSNPFDTPAPEPEPSMFDDLASAEVAPVDPVDMSVDPFGEPTTPESPPIPNPAAETIIVPVAPKVPPEAPPIPTFELAEDPPAVPDTFPSPEPETGPVEASAAPVVDNPFQSPTETVPNPFDVATPAVTPPPPDVASAPSPPIAEPDVPAATQPWATEPEVPVEPSPPVIEPEVPVEPSPPVIEPEAPSPPVSMPKPEAPSASTAVPEPFATEPEAPAAPEPEVPADVADAVSQAATEAIAAPPVSPSGLFRIAPDPDAELVRGDIPTAPQAPAPPAAAPEPSGPQWDADRDTYVQWDPVLAAWMQWDSGSDRWIPIST